MIHVEAGCNAKDCRGHEPREFNTKKLAVAWAKRHVEETGHRVHVDASETSWFELVEDDMSLKAVRQTW